MVTITSRRSSPSFESQVRSPTTSRMSRNTPVTSRISHAVTPEVQYGHPYLTQVGHSTNSLFRRVSSYVREIRRDIPQSPFIANLFNENGATTVTPDTNQDSSPVSQQNPRQDSSLLTSTSQAQLTAANPTPSPDPAPMPSSADDPSDPDHDSSSSPEDNSVTSHVSRPAPNLCNEFLAFLTNIARLSMDTIQCLVDNQIESAYQLQFLTFDDLSSLGICIVDSRHLLKIQEYYRQYHVLPQDQAYLNYDTKTPLSPVPEVFSSPGSSPFAGSVDDSAASAVVSLPLAKIMTIPKLPTDYSQYLVWRDKALTVLGHNGWLPTIQGEVTLTTPKELWLNNQVFYQLKEAVRDTDASHIVNLHGPQDIYTDSQGDGRSAWKDLIIWMEHPQRLLLISTALEKQLQKLTTSSGRNGLSMGMFIAQFNHVMVEHQCAA